MMHFFHGEPFLQPLQPSIAAMGNFDGMHLGHQALLNQLVDLAKQQSLKSTVIIFEPQPLEFFLAEQAPVRLQTLSDKLTFFKKFNIDQVVCFHFNQTFATRSAEEFIEQYLIEKLKIRGLLVSKDIHFGRNRSGTLPLLQGYQSQGLLDLYLMPSIEQQQMRVSSTLLREYLQQANFDQAAQLLGRPYAITGRVIYGAQRGRLLEFPTANIALNRYRSPLKGVYAIRAQVTPTCHFYGVANIGTRPTVNQTTDCFLEAFLFTDQNLNLYGQRLSVECLAKVRDEQRFNSVIELKSQIQKDVSDTENYFRSLGEAKRNPG